MTPKERAAMQQALDYLKNSHARFYEEREKTITALREALADHTVRCKGCDELFDKICLDDDGVCASCGWPVWPAKKQAEQEPVVNKSLTTQEQKYACNPHPNAPHGFCRDESITQDRYVCECEFWEQEQSEQEQSEQEPVAEVVLRKQTVGFGRTEERKDVMFLADVGVGTKLYAAPVRTKDLTDDEIKEIWSFGNGAIYFARAVIAADREKNKCQH